MIIGLDVLVLIIVSVGSILFVTTAVYATTQLAVKIIELLEKEKEK